MSGPPFPTHPIFCYRSKAGFQSPFSQVSTDLWMKFGRYRPIQTEYMQLWVQFDPYRCMGGSTAQTKTISFLPARRSAIARSLPSKDISLSVLLSVCHTPLLCLNG